MILTNYHSHCNFCDGSEEPELYVLEAIKQGFSSYGFSSHIPLKNFDTSWNMKKERLEEYIHLISLLKEKYKDQIELFCAFETDFKLSIYLRDELLSTFHQVDYTVGSIHYVGCFEEGKPWEIDGAKEVFDLGFNQIFGGNRKAVLKSYFDLTCEMLETEKPDILGHADKIKMHGYFNEDDSYYRSRMNEVLELLKENELIMEINTRGYYKGYTADFYPAVKWIKQAVEMGIKLQVNSDSHELPELSLGYEKAFALLKEIGLGEVWKREGKKWIAQTF